MNDDFDEEFEEDLFGEKKEDFDSQFEEFERRAKELVPQIQNCNVFCSICPLSPDDVDIKFAVQLGIAIMLNKPIIAAVRPGTPIPEKLSRVVDRFIEFDMNNADQVAAAIREACDSIDAENGEK